MSSVEQTPKHLGQSGTSYAVYTDKFDSSLLERIPRTISRQDEGIVGDEWFVGFDVWHCREASFLTNRGLPVAGVLKLVYEATSTYIVESKSIKLYLNSFDMCKMGETLTLAIESYEKQVKSDLEELLEIPVDVKFFSVDSPVTTITDGYVDLVKLDRVDKLVFTDYKSEVNHLKFIKREGKDLVDYKVFTNTLRSRCRHTKQKDTGSAYIRISTKNGYIEMASLLQQIVSLREKDDFHEPIAERLFKDITSIEGVTDCMVMLLYSRRGSLDINPVRSTSFELIPVSLIDVEQLTEKTQGQ